MKFPKKGCLNWILTGVLLGVFSVCCKGQVTFLTPPQNITVTRGSDVTISCGYQSSTGLLTEWIINGTRFTQQELLDNPRYQHNDVFSARNYSLTVFSINGTTTFQCIVMSNPTINSTRGTVTVNDVLPEGTIAKPPENLTVCRGSDVTISCGYVPSILTNIRPVIWIINGASFDQNQVVVNSLYRLNRQTTPTETSLTVFSINDSTTIQCVVLFTPNITSSRGTVTVIGPNVTIESANVNIYLNEFEITVSWQASTNCIIMYNVSLMDQYGATIVTVPANVSSIHISELPDSSTDIVADKEYTITVSAISDHEYSFPSNPVVVNTFILQNCDVTSPSIGTIRISCDSSHQILVTLTCTNNCSNPMVTSNGSSPLAVTGLDSGVIYNVIINVFNGSQVVLSDQMIIRTITVMRNIPDNNESTNDGSGGSSAGAIAGGVIGGIIVIIIIIIIIIVIYFIVDGRNKESVYDDTTGLKSPPGTSGTHASEGDSNAQHDKVLYAAPAQIATIPHQTSASGEQYAVSTKTKTINKTTVLHHTSDYEDQYVVSTKTANKSSEEQLPSDQYDAKKGTQEITYADLQELPTDSQRNDTNHESAVTYSQIA